ncbi:MAG: NADP-dependent oxidoreductase [Alkalibacterium sp.]|nr:NADP-dependent oxidoreductase [Alkalibacterium sp.]
MKAIVIEAFGGVEELQLKEVDHPVLKPNRMIVQMHATSVNPVDTKRRKGSFGGKLPMIVGNDVAGMVTEVGEDVTEFKVGDRVMANGAKTYAEYVSVNPERAVKLHDSVSYEEAAAIPLTGQTAYEAIITRGKVKEGDRVLVHAGSGGVGSLAIQLAKLKRAWVASTAGSKNQVMLTHLGADHPVNYETEVFEDVLDEMDLVFDTLGGSIQKKSIAVLRQGGRLLSVAEEPDQALADEQGIEASYFSMSPTKEALEHLNEWLSKRDIRPVITKVVPFTEKDVREAHALSETGHAGGKIIIAFQ